MLTGAKKNTTDSAMEYTDLNSLDNLLSSLNKPKQEMPGLNKQPVEIESESNDNVFDPTKEFGGSKPKVERNFDSAKYNRQGRTIAKTIDTLAGGGLMKLAQSDDFDAYRASEPEIVDLSEAWGEYSEEQGVELPPWLGLAILNLTVYAPRFFKALNDKRLAEQQEQISTQGSKIDDLYAEIENLKKNENGENEKND